MVSSYLYQVWAKERLPKYESRYASTTQYMSWKFWRSVAIVMRAVETIVVSITENRRPPSMLIPNQFFV